MLNFGVKRNKIMNVKINGKQKDLFGLLKNRKTFSWQ